MFLAFVSKNDNLKKMLLVIFNYNSLAPKENEPHKNQNIFLTYISVNKMNVYNLKILIFITINHTVPWICPYMDRIDE